jgi:hypothetical protein
MDRCQYFVGARRGLEGAEEKSLRCNLTFPSKATQHEFGIQREHYRRQFGGRIGVRQIVADRAAIAYRSVSDMLVGRDDEWRVFFDDLRGQHVSMARQSADQEPIAIARDPVEPCDSIDVNKPFRRNQP